MTTVSYNARERRVVIEDDGSAVDADRVASAITACGEPDHLLVVDLTYLPSVPVALGEAVDVACRELQAGGCPVRVWTAAPAPA